jgi:hypothetical protein
MPLVPNRKGVLLRGKHPHGKTATFVVGVVALVILTLWASQAAGTPSWRGDYDTGDTSQWTHPQFNANTNSLVLPGDFVAVTAPLRQGAIAGKFIVKPGDCPINCPTQERSEVFLDTKNTRGREGQDVWYAWSSYFPNTDRALGNTSHSGFGSTNPVRKHQNMVTQWHGIFSGEANVALLIDKFTSTASAHFHLQLIVNGCAVPPNACHIRIPACFTGRVAADNTYINIADMYKLWNRWLDFRVHIRWSSNPALGFVQVEMAHDGSGYQTIFPKTSGATLYTTGNATQGNGVYLMQGFYRINRTGLTATSTVYHDATRIGATAADIGRRSSRLSRRPGRPRTPCSRPSVGRG